jgi:hypothetical protein
MTREEHLAWCKKRALELVETGDVTNAWASMVSDLEKCDETREHPAIQLGTMLLMSQNLNTKDAMKKFIEGFN